MTLSGIPRLGLFVFLLAAVAYGSRQWGITAANERFEKAKAAEVESAEAAKAKLPILSLIGAPVRKGEKTVAVEMQNSSRTVYDESQLQITFRTEDGEVVTLKRYWLRWLPNETKVVYLEKPIFVEKISVEGTASQGRFEAQWPGVTPLATTYDSRIAMDPYTQGAELAKAASEQLTRVPLAHIISRQEQKVQSLQAEIVERFEALKER